MLKKNDFVWLLTLFAIVGFLLYPSTHSLFILLNKAHPYLMGIIKFSILATMGELLALRLTSGDWKKPTGLIYRAIIWGFLGMVFVLVFDLFFGGVANSTRNGLLPNYGNLGGAFFTSLLMNFLFGPTFMAFHRITDTYIDLGEGNLKKIFSISLIDVIKAIDWYGFISFVVLKTVPFFWVPAHTITFLLPAEYRVLAAAFLSIALGAILAFAKRRNVK